MHWITVWLNCTVHDHVEQSSCCSHWHGGTWHSVHAHDASVLYSAVYSSVIQYAVYSCTVIQEAINGTDSISYTVVCTDNWLGVGSGRCQCTLLYNWYCPVTWQDSTAVVLDVFMMCSWCDSGCVWIWNSRIIHRFALIYVKVGGDFVLRSVSSVYSVQ